MRKHTSGRHRGQEKREGSGLRSILTPGYHELARTLEPRHFGIAIPLKGRALSKRLREEEGKSLTNHVGKDDQTPNAVFVVPHDELHFDGDRSRAIFNLSPLVSEQEKLFLYVSVLVKPGIPYFVINGGKSAPMSDGFRQGYFLALEGSVVSESRANPRHTAIDVGGRTLALLRVFINPTPNEDPKRLTVVVECITPSSSQELPQLPLGEAESKTA